MLVRIGKIKGSEFMTFRKPFEFDITYYEGKTVQIDGKNLDDEKSKSNGSGKSTLLETINWGLFGELCRKNRYKDEVINKLSKKASIQIFLEINHIPYKIERTIERKKTPSLRIWKEEKELWAGSTYQTKQLELEKILRMNFLSFQCSVMFGRDFMNFPDLLPSQRAKILSDIRGLDKYLEGSKKAGESAKALQLLVQELDNGINNKEGKLTGIRSTTYKSNIDEFEREREVYLINKDSELNAREKWLTDKKLEVETKKKELQNEIDSLENRRNELIPYSTLRKEISDRFANEQSEMNQITFRREELKRQIDRINREIQKFTKSGEGPCQFCGQTITGEYLQSRINQLGLDIMEINAEIGDFQPKEIDVRILMKKSREELDNIDTYLNELDSVKDSINDLKLKKSQISNNRELSRLESEIEQLKKNIELKKKEANPYIEMEEQRKIKIKEIGAEIREANSSKKDLLDKKSYFDFWVEGFKKIRMMVFDSMISQLESLSQYYLSEYSSELRILMTTERETRSGTIKDEFHIAIVDSNEDEVSYEMYSGGERQKIRLSISRALSQFIKDSCGVDFSVIAFDEPNDSLDDVGKDVNFEIFQILSETEGKAVLVTDHDSLLSDKFDHRITVIKENGESRIII